MGRPRKKGSPKLLTEVELELMTILWELGEGTVREVRERLPRGRNLATTSVSTMLRVLEAKRLVRSRKDGRSHVYRSALTKGEYERRSLRDLVDRVFEGTPSALVQRLLDDEGMTRDEVLRIQRALEEKLR